MAAVVPTRPSGASKKKRKVHSPFFGGQFRAVSCHTQYCGIHSCGQCGAIWPLLAKARQRRELYPASCSTLTEEEEEELVRPREQPCCTPGSRTEPEEAVWCGCWGVGQEGF